MNLDSDSTMGVACSSPFFYGLLSEEVGHARELIKSFIFHSIYFRMPTSILVQLVYYNLLAGILPL